MRIRGFIAKCLIILLLGSCILQYKNNIVSAKEEKEKKFHVLSADEIVADMGVGWNLGNTMDGHDNLTPSETAWQSVVTTQKFIKEVHDRGFQTLRVPVTWGNKIDDTNDYQIDKEWLKRLGEIVDYGIQEGMYVIINIHHDGADNSYWLNTYAEDMDVVYQKFSGVWKHIAEYFKDYDEHLIFESMNEVYGDEDILAVLNQKFVDAVRGTGGNNRERWLSVPGSGANIGSASYNFRFPKDSVPNRLFYAVHYYDWNFGLEESMETTTFTKGNARHLNDQLEPLQTFFTSRGIPVILGEFGCIDKNNTAERAYFNEVSTRICKKYKVVPVYWDNGYHDKTKEADYGFSLFDRENATPWYPEIIQGMMRGYYLEGSYKDVQKNPTITAIDKIVLEEKKIQMEAGETKEISVSVEPVENNDVVLWKSENERVATVYQGKIHAVSDGKTNIIAFSQSGQAKEKLSLVVGKEERIETKSQRNKKEPVAIIGIGTLILVAVGCIKRKKERKEV